MLPKRPESVLSLPGLPAPVPWVLANGASPAPTPGSLFPRRKSDQNAAGDAPVPGLPNRTLRNFDTQLPLNFHEAAGLLVIGAVGIPLRLSPLGLIGISCRAKQTDGSTPLTGRTRRAQVSRSRTRYPPQIRCPKDLLIQWLRNASLQASDWTKSGGRGDPGGVFTRPQAGAYEANRRIAAALRPSGLLFRRGKSDPGSGAAR